MKIVELFLDDLQDISGLDGISLVEKPAHESNWLAFAEDENQKNIYEVLTPEQLYNLAIELNKLGEPVGYLESQGWKLQKIEPIKNQMRFAINIISNPNEDSGEDSQLAYRIRYKYTGPKDKKNRAFCDEMMRQNRVFRREDIDDMTEALSNPQFGYYSIWNFRGSFNCRHYWNKLTYKWEGEIINKSSNSTNRTGVEQIPNEPTITTSTANSKDKKEKEKQARRIQTSADAFKVIEVIDDMPLFTTQEEAELMAEILGCKGSHTHELKDGTIGYMPCEKHLKEMTKEDVDTGAANLAVPLTTRGKKTQIVPMNKTMFSYDEDKMQITGAAIIPNKMIIRRSEPTADKPNGEIYYVFFSEKTTRKLAEKFIAIDKLLDATNIEHIDALSAESYVIESWIVDDPIYDKSAALGLSYPKGTWVITMQVNNPSVWKQIKAGKLNGFSVQGWFAENLLFT